MGLWWPRETGWHVEHGAIAHTGRSLGTAMLGLPGLELAETELTAEIRREPGGGQSWIGLLAAAEGPLFKQGEPEGYLLRLSEDGNLALLAGDDLLATARLPANTTQSLELRLSTGEGKVQAWVNRQRVMQVRDERFKRGEVALLDGGSSTTFELISVVGQKIETSTLEDVRGVQPKPRNADGLTTTSRIVSQRVDGVPGMFVTHGGLTPFVPAGFNYVRFAQRTASGEEPRKVTFNRGVYDAAEAEAALGAMAALGANTVRVTAWGYQDAQGFTGPITSRGLNGAYMENFVDFLRRAARHQLRVVAVLEGVPRNAYYDHAGRLGDGGQPSALITGANCEFLAAGPIAAKRAAIFDFLHYIEAADPALLGYVLGWEISGEAYVRSDLGPFRFTDRKVTPANGIEYDLADPNQRQACWDQGLVHWANELAAAVHAVDPQAQVGVGMWTSDAQGRGAITGLPTDAGDPRNTARPAILAQQECAVNFIDFHLYDWDGTGRVDAGAQEWAGLIGSGKPVLIGETGVPRKRHDAQTARDVQTTILQQSKTLGYQGALLWSWDLTQGPGSETWSAQDEGMRTYFSAEVLPLLIKPAAE